MVKVVSGLGLLDGGVRGRWVALVAGVLAVAACGSDEPTGLDEAVGEAGEQDVMADAMATVPPWENPEIFAINTEPHAATLFNFSTLESALVGDVEQSPFYRSLDGIWKFTWTRTSLERPEGFWEPSFDVTGWGDIEVPGNMELQGHGRPYYINRDYVFPMNQPLIPDDYNPVGSYRRDFVVPEDWDGQEIFIEFGAVRSAFFLWINGEMVGYDEDSKTPSVFNITDYVVTGDNVIAMELHRFSDGAYLEDMDFWRLSGFERGVHIYAAPTTRVEDYFARATLDETYQNGVLALDVDLVAPAGESVVVDVTLLDGEVPVFAAQRDVVAGDDGGVATSFAHTVDDVKPWSAEYPNLYTLTIALADDDGDVVSAVSGQIGFRSVELKDAQFLINGVQTTLRGVNLHEHDMNTGHYVPMETLETDLRLMKEHNINAIRTSHYPQPAHFYALTDKYGFYVVNEANVEHHGYMVAGRQLEDKPGIHLGYQPEWRAAHMDRMEAMVERDKNHPSVIIWSLGNEAGEGPTFQDMYDWTHERDSTRLVQYQAAGPDAPYTDLIVPFYPNVRRLTQFSDNYPDRVTIMSEYSHAMGNSLGNFQELWDLIYSRSNLQGGFVWDWVDQGILETRDDGSFYYAYGGDYGPMMPPEYGGANTMRGTFAGNGILASDRTPHPHAAELKKVYQPVYFPEFDFASGRVAMDNKFSFTDLSAFDFGWTLLQDGNVIASGTIDDVAGAPGEVTSVPVALPAIAAAPGAEYILTVEMFARGDTSPLLEAGHVVAFEQFILPIAVPTDDVVVDGVAEVVESDDAVTLAVAGASVSIDRETGVISSLKAGDEELMAGALNHNFWRHPVENDLGWGFYKNVGVWQTAGVDAGVVSVEVLEDSGDAPAGVRVTKSLADQFTLVTDYTMDGAGVVHVDMSFTPLADDLPMLPKLGFLGELVPAFTQIEWYGRGPGETYWDRKTGSAIGIYSGTIADQYHEKYLRPQETGNKTDVRWMTLSTEDGVALRVSGDPVFSGGALSFDYDELAYVEGENRHGTDVVPGDVVSLMIDMKQLGVGGDDSWGKWPMPKYRIQSKPYEFGFSLEVISAEE